MKRTNPRLIINLNLSDKEFEEHIELAVGKYIDSIIESGLNEKVTEAVKKYVDRKIDAVIQERRYDNSSMIDGMTLSNYIAKSVHPKVEKVIANTVAQIVSETLATKFKGVE